MTLSNRYLLAATVILSSLVSVSCTRNGWSAAWGKQISEMPPGSEDRNASENVPDPVSAEDKDFAMKAAQGGLAEIELGTLAQKRGSTQQIRDFGKMLVDNHTALDNELNQLAAKHGLELPTEPGTADRQSHALLSKLSGSRFDREFVKDFIEGHHDDLAEFRKEAARGSNPALKAFAADTLATLHEHHVIAENIGAVPRK